MSSSLHQKHHVPKSPLIFLGLIAFLIVSTLVVASSYFLKPSIELELKIKLEQSLANVGIFNTGVKLSGRDVILNGQVNSISDLIKAEKIAEGVLGVRDVTNQLLVKNQTNE